MHRVLGVSCAGADAFLSVLDVGADGHMDLVLVGPEKVSPVSAGDKGDALLRSLSEWRRVLGLILPTAVVLLLPESDQRTKRVHAQWAPRCETETLVALASGHAGIPFDVVARATVRSRLGLGKLDEERKEVPAVGQYWKDRALAAFAARALATHAIANGWPALRPAIATGK